MGENLRLKTENSIIMHNSRSLIECDVDVKDINIKFEFYTFCIIIKYN